MMNAGVKANALRVGAYAMATPERVDNGRGVSIEPLTAAEGEESDERPP
jgi:hypothetical protein